ncbi:MAG: hypothetical protein PHX51_01800 [Clostridia bacterium]|nr:hypothetical protein [Clostridia bacterium]
MITSNRIADYAMSFALLIVARTLDQALSSALPINMAYLTIIIGISLVMLQQKVWQAAIVGFLFGLSSFTLSWIYQTFFGQNFKNPLISILPRIIVCVLVFLIYHALNKIPSKNPKVKRRIICAVSCGLGALLNTALVLGAICLFTNYTKGYFYLVSTVLLTNALPEFLLSVILTPLVVFGVAKARRINVCGIPYNYRPTPIKDVPIE